MKSKMLLALAGLLIGSMLFITPVFAQMVTYRANGTLETYADAWTSVIVGGSWSVEIRGDLVKFKAFYRELNLAEEVENSPVGTIDTFIITLIDYDSVSISGDECTVSVVDIHLRKIWWNLATGKPEPKDIYLLDQPSITIDELGILIDLVEGTPGDWAGQDFDIEGSTLSIKY